MDRNWTLDKKLKGWFALLTINKCRKREQQNVDKNYKGKKVKWDKVRRDMGIECTSWCMCKNWVKIWVVRGGIE